jgi:hypothetical protein
MYMNRCREPESGSALIITQAGVQAKPKSLCPGRSNAACDISADAGPSLLKATRSRCPTAGHPKAQQAGPRDDVARPSAPPAPVLSLDDMWVRVLRAVDVSGIRLSLIAGSTKLGRERGCTGLA